MVDKLTKRLYSSVCIIPLMKQYEIRFETSEELYKELLTMAERANTTVAGVVKMLILQKIEDEKKR